MMFKKIQRYHMNEGPASLLTLELLDNEARKPGRSIITHDDLDPVRRLCVFTTHTPRARRPRQVPDRTCRQVLGRREVYDMNEVFCCEGILNMTYLALNLSHYVNGVAKRHGEISRLMFSRYVIDAITNGVHAGTWTAKPFEELFDRYISSEIGEIQALYAGKAHPADQGGKEIIRHVFQISEMLNKQIKVADLENYDMFLGQMITSGVDVWLNTPQPPLEASGTSGMKAALNGVPSLSVLDGWWVEGCIEGVTGWAIGKPWRPTDDGSHNRSQDSVSHPAFLQQSRPVRRCHAPRNSA